MTSTVTPVGTLTAQNGHKEGDKKKELSGISGISGVCKKASIATFFTRYRYFSDVVGGIKR